jgi:hypothetical protein
MRSDGAELGSTACCFCVPLQVMEKARHGMVEDDGIFDVFEPENRRTGHAFFEDGGECSSILLDCFTSS